MAAYFRASGLCFRFHSNSSFISVISAEALGAVGHTAFFVVARPDFQCFIKLLPQVLKLLLLFIRWGQGEGFGQLHELSLVVLVQQHRLMDGIIDQEVLLREAGTEMPAQEGQNIVFGVDDRTQHSVVLFKADEALKLVYLPVETLFHLVERGYIRMAHPLDRAGAEGEGQMQEADEQKLFVLLPGEEIPADEIFRLPAKFPAKAEKTRCALAESVSMSRTG